MGNAALVLLNPSRGLVEIISYLSVCFLNGPLKSRLKSKTFVNRFSCNWGDSFFLLLRARLRIPRNDVRTTEGLCASRSGWRVGGSNSLP